MANTSIVASLFSQVMFSMRASNEEYVPIKLNVVKVSIRLQSKLFRHMLESGNTIVDARVIEPTTLDVDIFCQTLDDVAAVNKLLMDRGNFYAITTKGLVFDSMMLEQEKLRQTPAVLSAAPIHLVFKEVLVQHTPPIIFQQSADSSIVSLGIVALKNASQNVSGLLSAIKSSSLVSGISNLL
jgi:hypothetical protein